MTSPASPAPTMTMLGDLVLARPERYAQFHFDEAEHSYTLDGKPLPGVTTILRCRQKGFLAPWYAKECSLAFRAALEPGKSYSATQLDTMAEEAKGAANRKSKAGRETGTDVHSTIASYLTIHDLPTGLESEAQCAFDGFREWWDTAGKDYRVLALETRVYSEQDWYAGTFDLLARRKDTGRLALFDYKTNKSVDDNWPLQTGGYVHCLRSTKDSEGMVAREAWEAEQEPERLILRLPKTPGKAVLMPASLTPLEVDIAGFLAARMMYRWNSAHEQAVERAGKGGWG